MQTTKIEWCKNESGTKGYTWNPVTGCDNQLPCRKNCYARRMAKRLAGRYGYPEAPNEFTPTFHADKLDEPYKIKKPSRIFVCSMGDLFCDGIYETGGGDPARVKIMAVIEKNPRHEFIILTKRPDNMRQFFKDFEECGIPNNLIIGTSASTQEEFKGRGKDLIQIPDVRKVVSLEPLLGPIDITAGFEPVGSVLDWVIVGGEAGPGARPMHPDWVRKIRDDCKEFGIPFFFKGFGEWGLTPTCDNTTTRAFVCKNGDYTVALDSNKKQYSEWIYHHQNCGNTHHTMYKVGKKYSGRLLDGVEHNGFPALVEKEGLA